MVIEVLTSRLIIYTYCTVIEDALLLVILIIDSTLFLNIA